MIESRAMKLLTTFWDDAPRQIDPLDFTPLLDLQDRGLVEVAFKDGKIVAVRTSKGKRLINAR